MTSCPVCGKQVDPLRAPAVSVRDGRVVSYCSKDCFALAESGPQKLIPTKMMRLPSDNTLSNRPSSEHKAVTPSSGVVTTKAALDSVGVFVALAAWRKLLADRETLFVRVVLLVRSSAIADHRRAVALTRARLSGRACQRLSRTRL